MSTATDTDPVGPTEPVPTPRAAENDDHQDESIDQQFRSFMEGLRTTLPAAQVLVAFLLVLPVQAEFATLTGVERVAYYVAFAASMLASVLLIAPSVHQRMRSPESGVTRKTKDHLDVAIITAIIGTCALLVALVAVSYLVTSLVVATSAAVLAAAMLFAVAGYTWLYQPLVSFRRSD